MTKIVKIVKKKKKSKKGHLQSGVRSLALSAVDTTESKGMSKK